ncbi:MAG: ThiS-like ubiquitin domain-containing protein, partial [Phycisphaerales bacterium]
MAGTPDTSVEHSVFTAETHCAEALARTFAAPVPEGRMFMRTVCARPAGRVERRGVRRGNGRCGSIVASGASLSCGPVEDRRPGNSDGTAPPAPTCGADVGSVARRGWRPKPDASPKRGARRGRGALRTVLALRARHEEPMRITVNGRSTEMPAAADAAAVRARVKPGADLVIVNGAVVEGGHPVRDGDEVTLI